MPRLKIPPVRSMVDAAREFAAREPAPASIIKDLEKCIAVRTAVHELYTAHAVVESASDRGHGYFIQVLGCARRLLRTSEPTAPQPRALSVNRTRPTQIRSRHSRSTTRAVSKKARTAPPSCQPSRAAPPRWTSWAKARASPRCASCSTWRPRRRRSSRPGRRSRRSQHHSRGDRPHERARAPRGRFAAGLALEHPAIVTVENAIAAASLRVEESTATGDDFLSGSSGLLSHQIWFVA